MKINRKIGMVVNISAQNQSRVAQNTIGRMQSPTVQPMHCIIEMYPRRSLKIKILVNKLYMIQKSTNLFEISIAMIRGAWKIELAVKDPSTAAMLNTR